MGPLVRDRSCGFGVVCVYSYQGNPLHESSFNLMSSHGEINKEALWVFSLLSLYLSCWLERTQKATTMSSSAQMSLLPKDIAANVQKQDFSTQSKEAR